MPRTSLEPTLIGLDLNAARARAVAGPASAVARPLLLDGDAEELPLAISLEGRRPQAGRAGAALCRLLPHLVCVDTLASLGKPRVWSAGRHRLDAARCLALVFERLQPSFAGTKGFAAALPAYLTPAQAAQFTQLAGKAKLTLLGSVTTPLAVALAAHAQQPQEGLVLVADVDEHALSLSTVLLDGEQARSLADQVLPRLNVRAWKLRLIDAVAERCVRHSRRDPRDSAAAEQSLYEQLDDALEASRQGRAAELSIRATQWFQNLFLQPEEIVKFSSRFLAEALAAARVLLTEAAFQAPRTVLLTEAAGRLPGLADALQTLVSAPAAEPVASDSDDFGDDLFPSSGSVGGGVVTVLPADAVSRAMHELADRFHRGDLPREHLAHAAPLPLAPAFDVGVARLQFRDQDYPLLGGSFTLGRQAGCDLVFDSKYYPTVSARHCEIVCERRGFTVRDRSRNGTLLNGKPITQQAALCPGDWIRLGPDGPQLRFLGQPGDARKLGTTA